VCVCVCVLKLFKSFIEAMLFSYKLQLMWGNFQN